MDPKRKNKLLVTFPVDLGNRTYEKNLQKLFGDEMDLFRFAAQHADELDKGVDYSRSVRDRLASILSLRRTLSKYRGAEDNVLFHGLSPAFLSYGSWKLKNTSILLDWTRCLYPSVLEKEVKRNWLFYLHRKVLRECANILCMTDAVRENLIEYYNIPSDKLHKVPAPFDVESLDIFPRPTPELPRVLFVGGDLKRKGGEILLTNWASRLKGTCQLTMLTNNKEAALDGIHFMPGIRYGTPEHKAIFNNHDILILPTRMDSYPQAIGEAAAAGMAVITTKYALGAKDVVINGVSGYVEENPENCVEKLIGFLKKNELIDNFKLAGYKHMHTAFSRETIKNRYLEILIS